MLRGLHSLNSSISNHNHPNSLAIITGGLITGVMQVVLSISYAALVYGGELNSFVGYGIGFALAGALIIATVTTLFAALPGSVGSNQDVSVAIFGLLSASIVTAMPADSSLESTFYTVVIAIGITVLLTGLFFWGLGAFNLGGLVRYFPYPVVGGFLAGTGWLLFKGGLTLTVMGWSFNELFQPVALVRWLPGLILALILLLAVRRLQNNSIIPVLIIVAITVFYGTAWHSGYSLEKLSTEGWLLGPFPNQSLWQPLTLSELVLVEWRVIAGQTANIITVLTVSSIALLLNATAFELESKKDVDLNKELRVAGIGNLLSCISPGFVGFRQLCLTLLNFRMNAQSRLVGLIGAVIILLTLFFGASIISFFPRFIMGGLLMYLGLNFLVEWGFKTWFTLPIIDFLIIWLVLLVIATVGFMPGVAVGLVAALIMFVISYSQTEVVRHELTGKNYNSLAPRRLDQRKILDRYGEKIYILQLQGFIFFGTANKLFDQVKKRLCQNTTNQPKYVVLDFLRVSILDSTGMLSFRKLKELTNSLEIHLVITGASAELQEQMVNGGLSSNQPLTHYYFSLNAGIEWCEEQILKHNGERLDIPVSFARQLLAFLPDASKIALLLRYFERQEIPPGTTIIKAGTPAVDFFFLESGKVITRVKRSEESFFHLETMRNGRVIGDIGFYLGYTHKADVVTAEDCILYRLTANNLKQLENENSEIASLLHQIMVRLLAERVTHLVKTVNALQK